MHYARVLLAPLLPPAGLLPHRPPLQAAASPGMRRHAAGGMPQWLRTFAAATPPGTGRLQAKQDL